MRPSKDDERSTLTAEIAILRTVAAAFGIGQKSFGNLNRMLLGRSARGVTHDLEKLRSVHFALLEGVSKYFRRHGAAGAGGANEFADLMLMTTLSLYPRAERALCEGASPSPLETRLLIEEVLVPTAFALMLWRSPFAQGRMISSLGHEFDGPVSWYLPEDGRAFCAVWERWLRVTGFRTPCGFSRDSGALKDQGKRWLDGETLPCIEDIDRVVTKYADRVEWLDGPRAWLARLRLARAVQHFYDASTRHAHKHSLTAPESLRSQFEKINRAGILYDPDEWLASPRIFFAVRLVQERLVREGRLAEVIRGPTSISRRFSPRVSDETIAGIRERDQRRLSPGDRFLRYLARRGRVRLGPAFTSPARSARDNFEAAMFMLGMDELRRVRDEKRLAEAASRSLR